MADFLSGLSGLADLYGQYQSYQNANNAANTIGGIGNASNSAYQTQLQSLQNQGLSANATRDAQFNQSDYYMNNQQNPRLLHNIDDMWQSLQALKNPNSGYMQQARAAIERKDAASGRRSQWGEREVQLAGNLAQQYNQYAPGLQNAMTAAQNQLTTNQQALSSIYNNYSNPINNVNTNMTSLINQGGQNQVALANATMGALNNANNQQNGLLGSAIKGIGGIVGAAGGLSGIGNTISSWFGNSGGQDSDPLGDFGSSEGWW